MCGLERIPKNVILSGVRLERSGDRRESNVPCFSSVAIVIAGELSTAQLPSHWELVHEYIYHETGMKSDRRRFQAMLLACSQRKADMVVF